jgi:transcriptional regulator with XRE-family HTH domain
VCYILSMQNEIGSRVKGLREKRGWTQPELAERVRRYTEDRSVAVETLSKLEHGHHKPAAWMIQALAHALETTSDYILGLAESPDLPAEPRYPVPTADMALLVSRLKTLEPGDRRPLLAILEAILDYGKRSQRSADVDNPNRRELHRLVDSLPIEELPEVLADFQGLAAKRRGERAEGSS